MILEGAIFDRSGNLLFCDVSGGRVLRLTPDIIKLDITLVREVDQRPRMQTLIAALLTFAQGTGADLIAEGVESPRQLETLKQLGVPLGQGFHLGHPQCT